METYKESRNKIVLARFKYLLLFLRIFGITNSTKNQLCKEFQIWYIDIKIKYR